ncbi:transglutaminaseTgpA domain-containing protein [Enterococcus sp. LJL99]
MLNRIKEKWVYALICFLVLLCAYPPFLTVYKLEHSLFLGLMIGLFCLINLCFEHWWLRLSFLITSYFFTLYYYFPSDHSFGFTWLASFFARLQTIFKSISNGTLSYMPASAAMLFILMLIIALSVLVIHYEKWVLSFSVIIGYLFSLMLVNQLQLEWCILSIASLFLLLYLYQIYSQALSKNDSRKLFVLATILCGVIGLSAFYVPTLFPKSKLFLIEQTLPIRTYLNSKGIYQQINRYGLPNQSATGFSDDDKQLGGPINDDLTILFTAEQTTKHYWRVETKRYYTGKGWMANSETTKTKTPLTFSDTDYRGRFKEETTSKLVFNTNDTYLPLPYGNVQIPLTDNKRVELIEMKNRLNFEQRPKELLLSFQEPDYTINDLEQVPVNALSSLQAERQLPDTLPGQVQELALSLTESKTTLYDKVKAVEQYLKTDGSYRYSKTDAAYTPEDKDYVDHFLFETKTGYCDNFSSAMVVLLRSVGIPSRWAKGFAPGDVVETSNKNKKYAIRNSHAHSWPEVYFEGYGWIPFEPTPGFEATNESTDSNSSETQSTNSKESSSTSNERSTTSETSTSSSTTSTSSQKDETDAESLDWTKLVKLTGLFLGFLLLSIIGFFYYKNFFWLYFNLYQKRTKADFASSYSLLLKKAEKILAREKNEPLKDYAQRFEKKYPECHGAFIQATLMYEQSLYGQQKPSASDYAGLLTHLAKLLTSLKKAN